MPSQPDQQVHNAVFDTGSGYILAMLNCPLGANTLRRLISSVTQTSDPRDHEHGIKILKEKAAHGIVLLENGNETVNCFMFAFGLVPWQSAIDVRYYAAHPDTWLDHDCLIGFIDHLKRERHLEPVAIVDADQGDVVVYYEENKPVHAAMIELNDRLVSKWGVGNVWQHALWEVPEAYGSSAEVFRQLRIERFELAFFEYMLTRPDELPDWMADMARRAVGTES